MGALNKRQDISGDMNRKKCSVEGCNAYVWARNLCKWHDKKPKGLKRAPIKQVSGKQAKKNRAYSVMRKTFMEQHPLCKRCGAPATDLHHSKGRVGDNMLDTTTWISLCRSCHTYIEEHPEYAKKNGYSENRL